MKSFLALSGGGDRGCVLVGMLDELHEMKGEQEIQWNEVSGISAGALVAAMVAQTTVKDFRNMVEKLKKIFLNGGFHVVEPWIYGGQVLNMMDALLFHESIFQNTAMSSLINENFDTTNINRHFSVGVYNKSLCRYETFKSNEEIY